MWIRPTGQKGANTLTSFGEKRTFAPVFLPKGDLWWDQKSARTSAAQTLTPTPGVSFEEWLRRRCCETGCSGPADEPAGDCVLLGQHRGAEIRLPAAALGGTEQTDDPPCPPRAWVTPDGSPPHTDGMEQESEAQRSTSY